MKIDRALALMATATAVVALCYAIAGPRPPSTSAASIAALESRMTTVEQRLSGPFSTSDGITRADDNGMSLAHRSFQTASGIADDANSIGRARPTQAETVQRDNARRARLDAAFRGEPVNRSWASKTEDALVDAASSDDVAKSGVMPAAIDTQCRSSRCRIITRFAAGSDVESWTSAYILNTAGTLGRLETVESRRPDGSIDLEIYGSRQ